MGGEEGSGRERAGSIPENGLTAGKIDDCYQKCCGLSGSHAVCLEDSPTCWENDPTY